jgi:tRNA nucleotidyltransferase (CCA-adding enzyme)
MPAMSAILTMRELKAAELARREAAVADLSRELAAYAAGHNGRYILYGSAARGTMRHDSDVDILADFPPDALDDAWVFAEEACWRRRLSPDIRPKTWVGRDFLGHIAPDIKILA